MKHDFSLNGVCSTNAEFELDGDIVKNVVFHGGCNGNLKAIATLVDGMSIDEICKKLEGITCGFKKTSCTDQFTKALTKALEKERAAKEN